MYKRQGRDGATRCGEVGPSGFDDLAGGRIGDRHSFGKSRADPDADRLALGVLHLGGDGPLPDQLVQPGVIAVQAGLLGLSLIHI